MDKNEFLGPDPVIINLKAETRWEAIEELLGALVAKEKIHSEDRAAIAAAVIKRETSMSTGIGFGFGIPHASSDLVTERVAVGRSRKGVNFESLDNQPVKLVLLFVLPQGSFQKHLHVLANLVKVLHNADFQDELGDI